MYCRLTNLIIYLIFHSCHITAAESIHPAKDKGCHGYFHMHILIHSDGIQLSGILFSAKVEEVRVCKLSACKCNKC